VTPSEFREDVWC